MTHSGDKQSKARRASSRLSISRLAQRTPVAAGSLVVGAVLIGVLFYAQAGLLFRPTVGNYEQSGLDEAAQQVGTSGQPKDKVLDSQEIIVPPKPPATLNPQKAPSSACDESARQAAKSAYDRALSYENAFHKKALSQIGRFSRLLSNKVEAENERHKKAVAEIETKYRKALTGANCQA